MSDLVDVAISAHCGLDRWRQLRPVSAPLRVGGALWALKGKYLHNVLEQDHRGANGSRAPCWDLRRLRRPKTPSPGSS